MDIVKAFEELRRIADGCFDDVDVCDFMREQRGDSYRCTSNHCISCQREDKPILDAERDTKIK